MQLLRKRLGRLLPLKTPASPVRPCRRRPFSTATAVTLLAVLTGPGFAAPPCSTPGVGWCIARRFPGKDRVGELGFRFGEPLDVDGDGRADVAAGARFKLWHQTQQNGTAAVWSGATGAVIREWDGEWPDGLFGHWVMPVPDLSGDGLADLVIAAPHARVGGIARGILVARSPKTGDEIWRHEETEGENLGWDLTLAGDADGDGRTDLLVGAPAADTGRVYLVSGKDGRVLHTYAPPAQGGGSFGWYVARLDDVDRDGSPDFVTGGPAAAAASGARVGAAWLISSATGKVLRRWEGTDRRGGFGSVVTGVADLDHDGKADVAVAAPGTEDQTRTLPGEVRVYSSRTGKELRRWSGTQPGELYGRMVVATADLDGDGVADVAVGAPAYRRGDADRVGRVELRSGRTGALLAELIGDEADSWFGWHVRRAPDPEGHGRPALLIGSLRHPVDGQPGVGVIDLYVLRQGTKTRGTRRKDIR